MAFLAGGGMLNASFMREGLVNEIYLDVEPLIFGKGIQIIAPSEFEYELELLEVKKLNKDTVQLRYLVKWLDWSTLCQILNFYSVWFQSSIRQGNIKI